MPFLSVDELREKLSSVLDALEDYREPVVITRGGQRMAVLLSMDRFEAVKDILEDWEDEHDEELGRELEEARAAIARGEGRSFDEVYAELMTEDVRDPLRHSQG